MCRVGEPAIVRRPLTPAHLPVLWRLHSNPRTFILDTIGPLTAVDQMERVLSQWCAAAKADGFGYQLVLHPNGETLGVAGLSAMPLGGRMVANAYVRFFPSAWGHGYARAALRESLRDVARLRAADGTGTIPAHAVFITAEKNLPARRLAESLGFTLTDEQDPTEKGTHVVYARAVNEDAGAAAEKGAP